MIQLDTEIEYQIVLRSQHRTGKADPARLPPILLFELSKHALREPLFNCASGTRGQRIH